MYIYSEPKSPFYHKDLLGFQSGMTSDRLEYAEMWLFLMFLPLRCDLSRQVST